MTVTRPCRERSGMRASPVSRGPADRVEFVPISARLAHAPKATGPPGPPPGHACFGWERRGPAGLVHFSMAVGSRPASTPPR